MTGAARGVGAVIARRLLEAGAKLVLGDILDEEGKSVERELGDDARYLGLDVTREDAWSRVFEATLRSHARIDILVNNAARLHLGTIEHTSPEQARELIDVNLVGPFWASGR